MHQTLSRIAITVALAAVGTAYAGPSAEQIKQLGATLTPWGAEIAGNKDGTYPAYTGGMTKPPAGFDGAAGIWVDPYPDDKPVLKITAANVAQYADKLLPSAQEMIKRYPDTFRVDVYPTRRGYPDMDKFHADAAIKNASNPECKTAANGVGLRGCAFSTPFPIPSDGYEVMWNSLLSQREPMTSMHGRNLVVDANGVLSENQYIGFNDVAYWDPKNTPYEGIGLYFYRSVNLTTEPAKDAGTSILIWNPLRPDVDDPRTWAYTTGQRRVRLAPEFAYDTPITQLGGVMFFDEANGGFAGRMDRFDFKLVGKKEMYVPYNDYKAIYAPTSAFMPHHLNPDVLRWELRRVWVVEATLKKGMRHALSKRMFYVDEDSWKTIAADGYDQAGKLVRMVWSFFIPNYSGSGGGVNDFQSSSLAFDLAVGNWTFVANAQIPGGYQKILPRNADYIGKFNPQAMAGAGVR